MLYIRKNRIYFTLIIIVVFSASFICKLLKEKEETIATVSLPVSNKTIVLDAGHGSPDEG